jgi:hypothetical protein
MSSCRYNGKASTYFDAIIYAIVPLEYGLPGISRGSGALDDSRLSAVYKIFAGTFPIGLADVFMYDKMGGNELKLFADLFPQLPPGFSATGTIAVVTC